jgi:hypothetical protein
MQTSKKPRGKGKKAAMVLTPIRLPKQVVAYFKAYPNFSSEVRSVLEQHVDKENHAEQTAINQQRLQNIMAEENDDEWN